MTAFHTAAPDINRRRLLHIAGVGAAALSVGTSPAFCAQPPLRAEGLRSVTTSWLPERVRVAAIQSHTCDQRQDNLASMLGAIARLQNQSDKHQLIVFHALALHGKIPRDLDEAQRMAIDLYGPEVAAVGAAAQTNDAYIAFSALTADPAWPGHVIARNILMGPDGRVVLAAWQATPDASTPFLTTVESVLDRYIALYGAEAVLPLARTPIGNIALASELAAPEIYRALALRGAEIIIRITPHSSARWDEQACAAYNHCVIVSPARAAPLHALSDDDASILNGGGSVIVGPRGEILAEAGAKWDQTLSAVLPMAHYRATRVVPNIHTALVLPVYTSANDLA